MEYLESSVDGDRIVSSLMDLQNVNKTGDKDQCDAMDSELKILQETIYGKDSFLLLSRKHGMLC